MQYHYVKLFLCVSYAHAWTAQTQAQSKWTAEITDRPAEAARKVRVEQIIDILDHLLKLDLVHSALQLRGILITVRLGEASDEGAASGPDDDAGGRGGWDTRVEDEIAHFNNYSSV